LRDIQFIQAQQSTGAEMTIADLGSIGEFVGAIGVVITLIYLAFQIRQNTTQLEQNASMAKAAAVNNSNIALRQTRQAIFASEEVSALFLAGNADPLKLSELALNRYRFMIHNITDVMLDIYSQTLETNFSPENWESQGVNLVTRILGTNGGRWFWDNFQQNYPAGFRQEVDRILATS
jgi:hypothetical protein